MAVKSHVKGHKLTTDGTSKPESRIKGHKLTTNGASKPESRVKGHKLTTDGAKKESDGASSVSSNPSNSASRREIRVPGSVTASELSRYADETTPEGTAVINRPVIIEGDFITN
jgi:hypothetical protein